jgi:hypothetical protein
MAMFYEISYGMKYFNVSFRGNHVPNKKTSSSSCWRREISGSLFEI